MKKIKDTIQKIYTTTFLTLCGLMSGTAFVGATDLTNCTLVDGQLVCPGSAQGGNGIEQTFGTIMDKARIIVSGVTGVLAIVMVGLFTWKAFAFAKDSQNPNARAQNIQGLIGFAIGAALFGAASMFTGMFYNLFR